MSTYRTALIFISAMALAAAAFAQAGRLSGQVSDPRGGPVADAAITVTSGASAPKTTHTASDGTFSIDGLPAGALTLQIESPGFQRLTRTIPAEDAARPANLVLQIEGVTEIVAVVAPKLEEELPQRIEQQGVRVQTITSEQIENGGYDDVGQTLQALVPGLFVSPKAGAFDYVTASLQGSRTNEILWLVDGVRISNRLYNGVTPLDTLPAYMIERIEILEGGQGLFYGTQAVAGAVNVVTKSFADGDSGRMLGGFDTNKGSHVNLFTRASHSGHRFVLYGANDHADGFHSFPSDEYQPSTSDRRRSYQVFTVGSKYAYDFSKDMRLSAMYQLADVSLDTLRPARSSASQPGGLAGAFNDRVENIFSAKLDYTPQSGIQLFGKGYYHRWDSHYNESRNVIGSPGTKVVISDNEFWGYKDAGANLLARFAPNKGFEYFAGYDFQSYSGRDDVLLISDTTETVHALFGQVRTTRELMKKGTIAAGVRYNAPSHSTNATVWNVTGRYDVTGTVFLRGTVGTSFRYPDAYELFAIDPTCCFGNPNLKPESSTNVNGSIGKRLGEGAHAVNIEAIGFYRRVKDLIMDVDDGSGETTVTANSPDVVRVEGISVIASGAVHEDVSGSFGYTYTKSQTNELAGGYSAIAGIPSNQVEVSVDYHPRRLPIGLTLTVNGIGELFDTVSGFGDVKGGDYAVVNLGGRFFLDARRRHRINLRIENLFDKDYTTVHARGFTDVGATPFIVHNLGVPLTLHLSYAFAF